MKFPYLKTISLVSGLTLLTNFFGFIRELFIAQFFGISAEADSFFAAFTIISSCFLIFSAGTVHAAFMPGYQNLIGAGSNGKAKWLFRYSFWQLSVLLIIIVLSIGLGSKQLAAFIVPGFSETQINLTAKLITWLAPTIFFIGTGSLLQSVAHAHQNFVGPASIQLLNNLVIILFLFTIVPVLGVYGLTLGYLGGALFWWIVLIPIVKPHFFKGEIIPEKSEYYSTLRSLWPLLFLLVADQASALVQKGLVSGLETGNIAALNYAAKLEGLPVGIFAMAIATVFFPALVDAMSQKDPVALISCFKKGLTGIVLLSLPVTVFLVMNAELVVKILFERGVFDSKATQMTSAPLVLYSIGILFQGLIVYLNRVFFAAKNTILPMIIGIVSALLHVVFCWLAVHVIGYTGIAIGTTIYAFMYASLLAVNLRRIINFQLKDFFEVLWRPTVASFVMVIIYLVVDFGNNIFSIIYSVLSGGLIYLLLLYLLRDKTLFPNKLLDNSTSGH